MRVLGGVYGLLNAVDPELALPVPPHVRALRHWHSSQAVSLKAETPQFRGGNRYFFSENLYQSVSFIDVSLYGATQVLRNADPRGWGCVRWSRKKRYEGVRFNVIQRYEGVGGGIQFPGKKRYVTLEWPLSRHFSRDSYRGEIKTSRNKN